MSVQVLEPRAATGAEVEAEVQAKEHFLGLDALRGLASVCVLIFHMRSNTPGGPWTHLLHGNLAVDFFFLLSGFVVAHAYEGKLQSGRMDFGGFFRVRAIRLYPLIFLGAFLSAIPTFWAALNGDPSWRLAAAFLAMLALPAPMSWGTSRPFGFNGPVWSLFFEIAVNLLYGLIARWLTDRILVAIVVVSGAALIALTVADGWPLNPLQFDRFPGAMLRTIFPFFVGVLLYRRRARLPDLRIGLWVASALLVAAFAAPHVPFEKAYNLACAMLLFPLIVAAGSQMRLTGLTAKWAARAGVLSYTLYIIHDPFLDGLYHLKAIYGWPGSVTNLALVIVLAPVVWAADRYFDAPARRWLAQTFPPRQRTLTVGSVG